MIRKAFILAAGMGTRMGELTRTRPKPLIEVTGVSLLERAILHLKRAGVEEVVVNSHYLPEQIERFFTTRPDLGVKYQISYEPILLGTGGGLLRARTLLEGQPAFYVYNSDVYCEFNLLRLDQEVQSGAVAALAVLDRPNRRALLVDDHDLVVGWKGNKSEVEGALAAGEEPQLTEELADVRCGAARPVQFCGVQLVSNRIFDYLEQEREESFSILRGYMRAIREGERVKAVPFDDFWIDVGTPTALEELAAHLKEAH